MKFICAGYPKTGSKSASVALRELGYNVADALETIEVSVSFAMFLNKSKPVHRADLDGLHRRKSSN